jgi:hypothetical protein
MMLAATNWTQWTLIHSAICGAIAIALGCSEACRTNERTTPYLRICMTALGMSVFGAFFYDIPSRRLRTSAIQREWQQLPGSDRWAYRLEGGGETLVLALGLGLSAVFITRRIYPADGPP